MISQSALELVSSLLSNATVYVCILPMITALILKLFVSKTLSLFC